MNRKLFSISARSIGIIRIIDTNDLNKGRYIQIDLLMWIPFTPIFFVERIDGVRSSHDANVVNEINDEIIRSFRAGQFWKKAEYSIYLISGIEFYKKPKSFVGWIPSPWKAKRWTVVKVLSEKGMTYSSPRSDAFKNLEMKGYISRDWYVYKLLKAQEG